MAFLIKIITTILAPIAGKLITAYIAPKIEPVIEKVKEIEEEFLSKPQGYGLVKHRALLRFISYNPALKCFLRKCGWNRDQLNIVVKFCVLIAKKPLTDAKSREKWNADDARIVFDFLCVIAMKWIKAFKGKR